MIRLYIIYDGRACGAQGTENAEVLYAVGTDRDEAIEAMSSYGQCSLYSYRNHTYRLTDERWEYDHGG